MLPQATIWQKLRTNALDAIQQGAISSYSNPPTLESWLRTGTYTVSATSAKEYILIAAPTEIGSVFLSEAILNADRALEHSISLRNQLACKRWSSPAWTAVTFYYWTYHLAVALTRLLGKTSWWVTEEIADQLHLLAGIGGKKSGAGPYTVECGTILSATAREFRIKRSNQTRSHDAIWNVWHTRLREYTKPVINVKSTNPETRFYVALVAAANVLGDTWPSDLRNAVNYTHAAGYGAVRKKSPSALYPAISADPPTTFDEMVSRLEGNAALLLRGAPISEQVANASKVLVDFTVAMDVLFKFLLEDVMQRRHIDRRWVNRREDFSRIHAERFTVKPWPCQ